MISYSGLNAEQREAVFSNRPNILCLAGAGTGKTQVLTYRIARLWEAGISPENMLALTFTRAAGAEMKERVIGLIGDDGKKLFCNTFHAFCVEVIRENAEALGYEPNFSVYDQQEASGLLLEVLDDLKYKVPAQKIVEARGGNFEGMTATIRKQAERAIKEYEYRLRRNNALDFDGLISTVKDAITRSREIYDALMARYPYVFVDEFQDTDPEQWDIVQRLSPAYLFVVGDDFQCQPAGTQVTMIDGSYKAIEDIAIGDAVLSYNLREAYFPTGPNYTKKVTAISKHNVNELVEVSTCDGFVSRYTKNHRCYARIHEAGNIHKHVVYLMQNAEGWFRVGSTKLFIENAKGNFGVRNRLHQERGTNAWILAITDTASGAWLIEQICAYKHGIPQTTWIHENAVRITPDDLRTLYSTLGDLTERARACLEEFGRDINYPLFRKADNVHFSRKNLTEIHACNLIAGCMDVGIPAKGTQHNPTRWGLSYSQISEINAYSIPKGVTVYGLDVEGHHNYVADGILTHNSIYGFRGSDISIILNLAKDQSWQTIKLERNYRSTLPIVDAANALIKHNTQTEKRLVTDKAGPRIDYREPENDFAEITDIVERLKHNQRTGVQKITAVLARTNKQLDRAKSVLKAHDVPCETNAAAEDPLANAKNMLAWIAAIDNPQDSAAIRKIAATKMSKAAIIATEKVQYDGSGTFTDALQGTEAGQKFRAYYDDAAGNFRLCGKVSDGVAALMKHNNLYDGGALKQIMEWEERQNRLGESATAAGLLEYVRAGSIAASRAAKERDASKTYLMTAHGSKGLEFDEVFIIGAAQGTFPNRGNIEEERRLFYVAMTRAREYLSISRPFEMTDWNGNSRATERSQFIEEALHF